MWVILSEGHGKTDQANAKKGYEFTVTEAADDPVRPDAWLPRSFQFVTIHANAITAIKDLIDNHGGEANLELTARTPPEEP